MISVPFFSKNSATGPHAAAKQRPINKRSSLPFFVWQCETRLRYGLIHEVQRGWGIETMIFCRTALIAGLLVLPMAAPAHAQEGAAPAGTTASRELRPYRINPGDELEVYVWGEERLQRVIRVLPDGTFSFPLAGRIDALNKLPSDLEAFISKGLEAQYRGQVPQVTVSVRSPSGLQVSVIGKVRAPGSFTPGKYINVLEAIGIAGGPSEFADVSNVTILRKQGDRLVPIKVRLTDALKGAPNARDLGANGLPELQSGDTVIVP